ncbi:diacylglycerol kinase family protein [Corynebacterium sp.]|uniref:diacylglycerol/lipid kinase family protein n=1 Tax=Corynebacterium sp. TaxID=1720 RepID=UPI0026DC50BC|nr:diacylglycerol kinase family protein [Corynebacterium sp.]MDO5077347.1 diacylglycerol kinase family protein [Corynebacterium sp.]
MALTRIGIVFNPTKTTRGALETALAHAQDIEVSWYETTPEDNGQQATLRALEDGATLICAAGGDGTIRAVVEFLADHQSSADLGIIPFGTGNLLARNLGIPLNNPTAAFQRALSGTARRIDIGWAEIESTSGYQRHAFAVMAGFGIDAHMINETNDELKETAGWLAYVESVGRAVSASELVNIKLRMSPSSGRTKKLRAHTLIIGNCGTLQSGFRLLPDADPSDGELDILVLRARNIRGWLDTIRNVVWDNGIKRVFTRHASAHSSTSITHRRATGFSIHLDEPRIFEIDGDELGQTTHINVTIQPGAINVR